MHDAAGVLTMKDRLALLALAPLLVQQGRRVRATVPMLPEPPGDRRGTIGDGAPLKLLVLGDSAAAGVGAPTLEDALVGQVVARLAQRFRVAWRLEAATGRTTRGALERLDELDGYPLEVVIVSLGINDLTSGIPSALFGRRQRRLQRALRARGARHLVISGLPPIGGFPALPQPLRTVLGARRTRFDRVLRRQTERIDGAEHLPIEGLGNASMMATDGFHPGPPIYALWAAEVARRVEAARTRRDADPAHDPISTRSPLQGSEG
ncbi:MAG: SGNH/GDSL hydrolase family protein [Acidobacteriota bacterium]